MLRGTQVLFGQEAKIYRDTIASFRDVALQFGFLEVIIPSIWESETFYKKISGDTKEQMWTFKDKGDRDCCLIPEVTGIIQELFTSEWSKTKRKPVCVFYESRVYRYERPQLGRYREFTQFGVELLTESVSAQQNILIKQLLIECLTSINVKHTFKDSIARGLGYYTANGFEAECPELGAQKQVAGGGQYAQGVGWAIGVERVLLAKSLQEK